MQVSLRLLLFCLFLTCACTQSEPKGTRVAFKKLNLIVLLDLSDRLTVPGQVTRDTALLRHIYQLFENRVRRQFYIHSKDQLQVLVAPQRSLPAHTEEIEARLRISMPEVPMKERSTFLKKHEWDFFQQVDSLYHTAGERPANAFSGSDIWKFFDQYLPSYLVHDTGTINKVIVLTDGYFDFESLKDKKQDGCRYSYSEKIMQQARAAKKNDFKKLFDSCGLIPVHINQGNVSVMVAELNPKVSFEHEPELLEALWHGWLIKMGIPNFMIMRKTDLQEVKSYLSTFNF